MVTAHFYILIYDCLAGDVLSIQDPCDRNDAMRNPFCKVRLTAAEGIAPNLSPSLLFVISDDVPKTRVPQIDGSCHLQVWVVDLVLYQCLPASVNVGEAWMAPASWIQLFGFSLLLAGTIIYAQARSRPSLCSMHW